MTTRRIGIRIGGIAVEAEMLDTPCARAVFGALPLRARPREWGDEFYFDIPVEEALDDTAATLMKAGDIGYWPPGPALAIFFGPTPASSGEDPVAASEVNLVGRIRGDAGILRDAKGADTIVVEAMEE